MNSEERREVAARLRNLAGHIAADEELTLDALGLYRGENIEGYDTYGVMHLADLIDPTCHVIEKGHPDQHHVCYGCNACDFGWYESVNDEPYRYCPHCGARLVERSDA